MNGSNVHWVDGLDGLIWGKQRHFKRIEENIINPSYYIGPIRGLIPRRLQNRRIHESLVNSNHIVDALILRPALPNARRELMLPTVLTENTAQSASRPWSRHVEIDICDQESFP